MSKKSIMVFNYQDLNRETKQELKKINDYLVDLVYQQKKYEKGMRYLTVLARKFEELGYYSDIYYKMTSIQNILDNQHLSKERTVINCQLFDVYLECMTRKDYRNAMKMLKLYQKNNNTDFIKLHIASVYTRIFQLEKAELILEQIKDTQCENPFYYNTLLELLYKKKEFESVIELFPKVKKYDGCTIYTPYITIGKAYMHLGQEKEANKMFRIVANIIKNNNLDDIALRGVKEEVKLEETKPHPSRKECDIAYQIAMDEKNYEEAIIYLEKVIELSNDRFFINKSNQKLKELRHILAENN